MHSKDAAAKIRAQQKELNQIAELNGRLAQKTETLEKTIAAQEQLLAGQRQTVGLQRQLLHRQDCIFTQLFDYVNTLQQQMKNTLQEAGQG